MGRRTLSLGQLEAGRGCHTHGREHRLATEYIQVVQAGRPRCRRNEARWTQVGTGCPRWDVACPTAGEAASALSLPRPDPHPLPPSSGHQCHHLSSSVRSSPSSLSSSQQSSPTLQLSAKVAKRQNRLNEQIKNLINPLCSMVNTSLPSTFRVLGFLTFSSIFDLKVDNITLTVVKDPPM